MFVFREIWCAFFLNTCFKIRSFALLPTNWKDKNDLGINVFIQSTGHNTYIRNDSNYILNGSIGTLGS